MTFQTIVIAVVVGLVAGWLAQFFMKDGGYGLMGDVLLGVGGSFVGGSLFYMLGIAPGSGWFAMVVVAFVGAVSLVFAQRLLFQVRA
jgi:uncharacterized membrane protein YeaQ/YmgE (transglycosylase-associated protein family)